MLEKRYHGPILPNLFVSNHGFTVYFAFAGSKFSFLRNTHLSENEHLFSY